MQTTTLMCYKQFVSNDSKGLHVMSKLCSERHSTSFSKAQYNLGPKDDSLHCRSWRKCRDDFKTLHQLCTSGAEPCKEEPSWRWNPVSIVDSSHCASWRRACKAYKTWAQCGILAYVLQRRSTEGEALLDSMECRWNIMIKGWSWR